MSQRAAWSAWIRMVASLSAFAAGCGDVSGSGKTAAPEGGYTTSAIDASNDRATDGASPTGDANVGTYLDATAVAVVAAGMDANALGANADAADTGTPRATVEGGCDAGAGADCEPATPAVCDLASCPTGCCDAKDQCQPGQAPANCGAGGSACQVCPPGSECIECPPGQICAAERFCGCDPASCPSGCCDFTTGVCQQGLTNMVCGNFGVSCQNCADKGEICSSQQCMPTDGGIACAFNCMGCCDTNGSCSLSGSDTQCGRGGLQCVDCTKVGDVCMDGLCFGADGGQPCSETCDNGCCDPNGNCRPGFLDTQCGGRGEACQDCTGLNPPSTCDVNANSANQPVCAGQTCGKPYGGCPAALAETTPAPQHLCSTDELENAAVFCASGPNTAGCNEFQFSDQVTFGGQCTKCLQPFFQDFVSQVGILACIAPYLDATCNHNSACIADCVTESCFGCDESCDTQVQTGTCATYFQADQCVTDALGGPGAVCNPATYQGNFGAWLQAVGAKYCGK